MICRIVHPDFSITNTLSLVQPQGRARRIGESLTYEADPNAKRKRSPFNSASALGQQLPAEISGIAAAPLS